MNLNNKFLKSTNLGITIVIIIGILGVLNFFSYQIFYRWDLTQNKDFSISSVSKKTVSDLKDVINVKAYFSSDLPSQFINLKQEVGDILDEYINYSNGNVKVEFIEPKSDEATAQDLYLQGIPQLQFNVLENDKYQVVNGYLGLVIKYGDKSQAIPVIQDTANLEYQITSVIKKVTSDKAEVIGFWQGNGAPDPESQLSAAYKKLGEIYDLQKVDFKNDKTIPANITTLVIVGPKEKFLDEELKAIDAFFIKGGSLMVLVDGVTVGQGLSADKNDTGINKLLENYGLKLNNDLVLDASSGMAAFSQGFLTFTTNYPFWPKVLNSGFDKNNAAVAKLESLILPWASNLDLYEDKVKDNKVSILAKSSSKSWLQSENFNLNPQTNLNLSSEPGQYNLAVAISGKFSSAYNQSTMGNSRLIVVGDSDFISDGILRNYPDNLLFFQNTVDSLSLDQNLINIRSKGITDRPVKELSEGAKSAVRYGNVFGLTAIVLAFGLARYFMRRRASNFDQQ